MRCPHFRRFASLVLCSLLLLPLLLAGCAPETGSRRDNIPFSEDALYAVAYLGYQEMSSLDYYAGQYLDDEALPVHYLSDGDFYLIIPRYDGMELALCRNDLETSQPNLIYQDPDCRPFILQCNASDIFADATIRLTYKDETAEFSPFISLKDGSVDIGTQGLDITKDS